MPSDDDRPNLVFLMPDQLRADFLGCYGNRATTTPHLDRLAAQGTRYTNAVSAFPICVPARTSLLTGMHAVKTGVLGNLHFLRPDYADLGISTWPELLAEAGYFTAGIGKMHFHPWDARLGFQYRTIAEDKRWIRIRDDHYRALRRAGQWKRHAREFPNYLEHQGAIVTDLPRELTADGFTGDAACEFLRNYADPEPFAMMVGFPGPHCPYDPQSEALAQIDESLLPPPIMDTPAPGVRQQNVDGSKGDWNGVDYTEFPLESRRRLRAHYAALVNQIDVEVGRIMETLAETGRVENTIIIVASDHGDYLGDHGMMGKGSFFESAIRVPIIVAGPGVAAGRTCNDPVELRDVAATMLASAGVDRPDYMDARPLPAGGDSSAQGRDAVVGAVTNGWMVRERRWKLHKYATGETLLFDLENDPDEQCDLSRDPKSADELHRLDQILSVELMAHAVSAFSDRRVGRLFDNEDFGREGWVRRYPMDQQL